MNGRRKFLHTILCVSGVIVTFSSNLNAKIYKETKMKLKNLTQKARENFKRFFKIEPESASLAESDGEFFVRYVNFTFDSVPEFSAALSERERLMLTLGALIAAQGMNEYKVMLKAALNIGVKPHEAQEILYQSTPYIGMAKAADFIATTNAIFKELKIESKGARDTTDLANRQEKGLEIQRKIFGEAIDKGNAAAPMDSKHIRAFLSAHCFGDFYTREGLDLKFRELLTFVFLVALGGADAQVKAHIVGNLNIGNDRALLISTITSLIPYIGYPRSLNALALLDEINPDEISPAK